MEIFLRISQKLSSNFSFFNFLINSGRFFRFLQKVLECLRKLQNKKIDIQRKFSLDFSYCLRTRWDWETKNSRKIAEILDSKNSVKNLIFSVKNFYFIRIKQNWEYDNFEKIWETSHLENSEKNLIFPE